MKFIKLGSVADVRISGVDKKTIVGESPVRLCNYTDVYYNWTIRPNMSNPFMVASARREEIEKFRLHAGQVAITKDSETRDDIGHAAYVASDFDDVILGYHCALITPHIGKLDGQYLNALFRTRYMSDYLARNAGGSGQRYYLSESAIREIPITLPSYESQLRIAGILGSLDEKIELNRKKIAELEALAKTVYDYWFVQFDFPDENGKPYKSSGGKMVRNEQLKREVPEGWLGYSISESGTFHRGVSYSKADEVANGDDALPVYRGNNIAGGYVVSDSNEVFIPKSMVSDSQILHVGDVLIAMSSGSKAHVGKRAHLSNSPHFTS